MDKQLNKNSKDYDRNQIIEIYKTYLQMADKISDRRQSANSYFLTINTIIVGLISYMSFGGSIKNPQPFYCIISVAGMVICYCWYRLIRSYKDLNSGKFKIVHEIEKQLPISPFDDEWEILGRGEDKSKYLQFTKIEMLVPWVFFAIHAFVFLKAVIIYIYKLIEILR